MSLGPRIRRQWSDRRLRRRWLLGGIAFGISFVPLLGTLSYFTGLIFAPLFSLAAIGVGVDAVNTLRARNREHAAAPNRGETLARLSASGLRELATAWAIVTLILLVGMAWNRNCDPWAGLGFFLVGPAFSGVLGWACGLWGGVLASTRRRQLLLGATPFLFCLVVALWRLYVDPVVYAYDPFWGWFAGGIYDESVAVGQRYLRFRAYNAGGLIAALLAFRALVGGASVRVVGPPPQNADRLRLGLAVALVLGTAWVGLRGATWGFTATVDSIERRLPLTRETEHFVIHYAPSSATAREIDVIAAEHEFAWHRLASTLGREPASPVHSFVFRDPKQKRGTFGAGKVEVSLPWKGHIYLHHLPFPHAVMHHELAHTFGGTSGDWLLGVSRRGLNVNMGLVEGLANALAPRDAFGLDLHDQAAVLDRLKKRPPLDAIMGVGFYKRASSVAYTAAGSFVAWLIETEGIDPVMEVYASAGDFEAAFGRPLDALEQDWLRFLRARPVRDEDVETLRQRFKQRSIFRRPCAHRVDALRDEIGQAKGRGDVEAVVEHMNTLCSIEPDRAEHRIGLAVVHGENRDYEAALAELERAQAMEEMTHQLLAVIHERRGDIGLLTGRWDEAADAYATAMGYSLGEGPRRTLQIKRAAALDPAAAPEVLDYFQPLDPDDKGIPPAVVRIYAAVSLSERDGWRRIGDYLLARQLLNAARPDLARPRLERALDPDSPRPPLPSPELVRAARFALVSALVQTHAWAQARAVLDEIEADPGLRSGHALDIRDWRARVDFFEGYFGG